MQSSTPELNWDKLRKQGRLLEQEIDSRLSSFAKSISETYDEKELENLLHKLQNVVNNMAISIEQSSTPSQLHMLQRHRDILFDFEREFKKVKSNFRSIRDHNELLSGVGEEFNAYKSGNRSSSMQDYLLNERGKINNSHHQVDIVLDQAYETRRELDRQKHTMYNSNNRMSRVLNKVPLMNSLLKKINSRKVRDNLIMGVVVSVCVVFLLWFMTKNS